MQTMNDSSSLAAYEGGDDHNDDDEDDNDDYEHAHTAAHPSSRPRTNPSRGGNKHTSPPSTHPTHTITAATTADAQDPLKRLLFQGSSVVSDVTDPHVAVDEQARATAYTQFVAKGASLDRMELLQRVERLQHTSSTIRQLEAESKYYPTTGSFKPTLLHRQSQPQTQTQPYTQTQTENDEEDYEDDAAIIDGSAISQRTLQNVMPADTSQLLLSANTPSTASAVANTHTSSELLLQQQLLRGLTSLSVYQEVDVFAGEATNNTQSKSSKQRQTKVVANKSSATNTLGTNTQSTKTQQSLTINRTLSAHKQYRIDELSDTITHRLLHQASVHTQVDKATNTQYIMTKDADTNTFPSRLFDAEDVHTETHTDRNTNTLADQQHTQASGLSIKPKHVQVQLIPQYPDVEFDFTDVDNETMNKHKESSTSTDTHTDTHTQTLSRAHTPTLSRAQTPTPTTTLPTNIGNKEYALVSGGPLLFMELLSKLYVKPAEFGALTLRTGPALKSSKLLCASVCLYVPAILRASVRGCVYVCACMSMCLRTVLCTSVHACL
jgi:hypothetical protein